MKGLWLAVCFKYLDAYTHDEQSIAHLFSCVSVAMCDRSCFLSASQAVRSASIAFFSSFSLAGTAYRDHVVIIQDLRHSPAWTASARWTAARISENDELILTGSVAVSGCTHRRLLCSCIYTTNDASSTRRDSSWSKTKAEIQTFY